MFVIIFTVLILSLQKSQWAIFFSGISILEMKIEIHHENGKAKLLRREDMITKDQPAHTIKLSCLFVFGKQT